MGAAGSNPAGEPAERGFPPKLRSSRLCAEGAERGSGLPAILRSPENLRCVWIPRSERSLRKRGSALRPSRSGHGTGALPDALWVRSWKRLLSHLGGTLLGLEQALAPRSPPKRELVQGDKKTPDMAGAEWPTASHASLFLPEFPVQPPLQRQQLKILGFLAKGTFGTVLKVLDSSQAKVFALKVVPKVEVLRRDSVRQCKEEVSIQRQVHHPFLHCLGDSWQGKHHLFIMCSYCSSGDLFTLWKTAGPLAEGAIRLFATELVLVLAYLHNQGIVHRDIKMENILLDEQGHLKLADFGLSRHLPWGRQAFTICGTLQYMAPEVLSGGPYAHAADWWSLGVLLFAMATGQFPVSPERDHLAMLRSVKGSTYAIPAGLSCGLRLLLSELLCQDPQRRPCRLHHFRAHLFFRGMSFDADTLRKQPADFALRWQQLQSPPMDPAAFLEFDCDLGGP
ncbi:ribosomal protein S6 kinase-related protein [Pantherophis guttatus]|uniref:Ribosomal protein S6 kinase-related protein n=1 Tax=Pantherophis guttatus TaxID=94885 RepID=A0A6P9CKL4_PANGU|nr:ribosomal protein S6 kinase-related protein [Pantherophis guttatus]